MPNFNAKLKFFIKILQNIGKIASKASKSIVMCLFWHRKVERFCFIVKTISSFVFAKDVQKSRKGLE